VLVLRGSPALGDAVNLAPGSARTLGAPFPDMICREPDRVLVKGKGNAVTVYQLLGR